MQLQAPTCKCWNNKILNYKNNLAQKTSFPGTEIRKCNGHLETRVNRKPTETRSLLHYKSHANVRWKRTAGSTSSNTCLWRKFTIKFMRHSWSPELSSDHNLQLETFVHLLFFFFNFVFSNLFCFTLLLWKSFVSMVTVFHGRVWLWVEQCHSTVAYQTGHACQDFSKVTCWSGWFLLLSWYPEICHVCFTSSVCFTHDLAHLKKSSLASSETAVTILAKGNTSVSLTVLSMFRLIVLFIDFVIWR